MKRKRPFRWRQFGRDLKAHRTAFGWGLREVARVTNMHHATLCRAEAGKPIDVPDFAFLCQWHGLNPNHYLHHHPAEREQERRG